MQTVLPAWTAHLPAGVHPAGLDLLAGGSLPAVALSHWRRDPSRRLLQDIDGVWLSGERLEAETSDRARRLGAAGLSPGDRVMLCAGTSAALVCAYLAVLRAGLVAVPVNPGYTRREVERLLAAARPAAALIESPEIRNWVGQSAPHPLLLSDLDLVGLPPAGKQLELDRSAPAAPALLLYTSGTTGEPKGALLNHGNLLSSARAVAMAWRWTAEDRLLLTLPLFHMHGLGVGINGSLVSGGQVVLRPGFDAADVAERCGRGEISMFFGVPAMYERLLSARRADGLSGLRLIVSGSAPLAAAQSDSLAAATGQRPLERYGMTETVMLTSNPVEGPRRPGSVGLPLPGVELRLADGGEVQVRGPNVLEGYDTTAGGTSRPRDSFTPDGWFRTGDLGERDEAGYLRLVGRSKELIISGGFNVYPREVEEVLAQFPGVREIAVIGRPSAEWGEAVTAVVVSDGPVDPSALRRFAAQQLAAYKVPKSVEFTGELPRNSLGKILRHRL